MIEVRVLEFNRLGKAYVFDPKTLNVYETESVEGNPYCAYDEESTEVGLVALLVAIISFFIIDKLNSVNTILAIIGYIILLISAILFAKFTAYQDICFREIKDLEPIDKFKNGLLISNFINNILENHGKTYYMTIFTNIVLIVILLLDVVVNSCRDIESILFLLVFDLSFLLFNNEWKRRKDLKKLLASLEQN